MVAGIFTTFFTCILWQFLHSSSGTINVASLKYSRFKAINWDLPLVGHKFNVTPIATTKVTSHIKCMAQCGKTEGCVAINMSPLEGEEHECELLDLTRYSKFSLKLIVKPGWTYTGPKVYT